MFYKTFFAFVFNVKFSKIAANAADYVWTCIHATRDEPLTAWEIGQIKSYNIEIFKSRLTPEQ